MLTDDDSKSNGLFYLKAGALFFWACWFTLAATTNIFDLINALWGLPTYWHFRSGNFILVASVLSLYNTPTFFYYLVFIIDILIQATCAILFAVSFLKFWRHQPAWSWINYAFTLSLALWAAFIIIEELFIAYAFEATHIGLCLFELLILFALHFLPHQPIKEYECTHK